MVCSNDIRAAAAVAGAPPRAGIAIAAWGPMCCRPGCLAVQVGAWARVCAVLIVVLHVMQAVPALSVLALGDLIAVEMLVQVLPSRILHVHPLLRHLRRRGSRLRCQGHLAAGVVQAYVPADLLHGLPRGQLRSRQLLQLLLLLVLVLVLVVLLRYAWLGWGRCGCRALGLQACLCRLDSC